MNWIVICSLVAFHFVDAAPPLMEPEDEFEEILKTYISHQRPRDNCSDSSISNQTPVLVDVSIHISAMSSINVVNMDITLDFMLLQRWTDSRLRLKSAQPGEIISISYLKDKVWSPDIYIRNAKSTQAHKETKMNYLLWLRGQDGVLISSQKLSAVVSCPMKMWNFPFDTQKCVIELGSFGFPTRELQFRWWKDTNSTDVGDNPVSIEPDISPSEFYNPTMDTETCDVHMKFTGNFSCLRAKLVMQRRFKFYLTYTYMPSTLVVLMSWTQFMVDHESAPARVSLGLLPVLAIVTQTSSSATQLPRISGIKAVDVWLFVCLAFVSCGVLEYALVSTLHRRSKYRNQKNAKKALHNLSKEDIKKKRNKKRNYPVLLPLCGRYMETSVVEMDRLDLSTNITPPMCMVHIKPKPFNIDKLFIFLYPVCFILFNFFYWSYYFADIAALHHIIDDGI